MQKLVRFLCLNKQRDLIILGIADDDIRDDIGFNKEGAMIPTFEEYMKAQVEEIKRHKWIESEKACCDLGELAVEDWIKRYANVFRKQWEDKYGIYC